MASQAAFDIQRLTETALTIKEPYEPIQPHGLEVWRVEERIAHEAPATSLFLAREARATADIQRLRDATGSLIDQTTAAQVQAAVLIENARFQYERLQTLIDPPKLAAMQALYERSLIEQTRYRLSPEDYEAAQEQARLYDDIFTVVYAYCPLYHESHKERQQDAELVAVLTRLAMRLRPGLRNPYAAGELRRQAAQAGLSRRVYLRTTIFPAAIIRVASEVATPQRMRVGREWVVNEHGKVLAASPVEELPGRAFLHWFFSQVYVAAAAMVLGQDYPGPIIPPVPLVRCEEEALERLVARESPGARESVQLTALLQADETASEDQFHRLLTIASPRACELFILVNQGLTVKEAATVLGMSPSTAYVH